MSDNEKTLLRQEAEATVVRAHPDVTPTVVHGAGAPSDDGPVTPEAPGRYDVRSEYGRGGQSRVLLAFDGHLGREIALKELLPEGEGGSGGSGSQAASGRFLREARITGQLEHPNIVPVYELGRHPDGAPYYTQKLVRGVTLKKKLAEARTLPERLKLLAHFSDICHAVAYAHSRGVVHRDLKPENVMVGQFGETVVLDWGLAKARGQKDVRARELIKESERMRAADATLAGHALGTPSYMSPEQAQGRLDDIDERSDVWSLGAILFEILTGRPPFEGSTAHSVIEKVITDAPPRVRAVLRDAPPELAAVAERALQRDRALRYGSAEEVAREVEAYLTGGNVRAYQYSSWELLRRFVQRHRALTAVSGLALLLLVAALFVIRGEAARARAALAEARHNLAQAFLEKAHAAERDFLWHRAEIFYAAARVQEDGPEARWGSVVEGAGAAGVTRIAGPEGWVRAAAFSPDGASVAAASSDGTVRLFALRTGRQAWAFRGAQPMTAVAFHGSALAARDAGGVVRVLDAGTGAQRDSFPCPGAARWVPADRAGCRAGPPPARVAFDDGLRLLDRPGGALERGHGVAALSPDGKLLASASARTVTLWDARSRLRLEILPRPAQVLGLSFSPDSTQLAVAEEQSAVVLWDVRQRPTARAWVRLPDGGSLVVPPSGRGLLRRDAKGALVRALAPGLPLDAAAVSPDGRLAAALGPGGLLLLDAGTGRTLRSAPGARGTAVQFLGSGAVLVNAGAALVLYDAASGSEQRRFAAPAGSKFDEIADGGGLLLARSTPRDVLAGVEASRLDRIDLEGFTALPDAGLSPTAIALSAGGKTLAAGVAGQILLLDPRTLSRQGALEMEGAVPEALAFSPRGDLLAAAGGDAAVHLYEVAGAREVAHLPIAGALAVTRLRFSADGSRLILFVAKPSDLPEADAQPSELRTLRIGDPARLPPPPRGLQEVLADHGVALRDGEITALPTAP